MSRIIGKVIDSGSDNAWPTTAASDIVFGVIFGSALVMILGFGIASLILRLPL